MLVKLPRTTNPVIRVSIGLPSGATLEIETFPTPELDVVLPEGIDDSQVSVSLVELDNARKPVTERVTLKCACGPNDGCSNCPKQNVIDAEPTDAPVDPAPTQEVLDETPEPTPVVASVEPAPVEAEAPVEPAPVESPVEWAPADEEKQLPKDSDAVEDAADENEERLPYDFSPDAQ